VRLIRVTCSTDRKGRPIHSISELGSRDDREELKALMDKDIRVWQAEEVADSQFETEEVTDSELDQYPEGTDLDEDKWKEERVAKLLTDPNLSKLWADMAGDISWEMVGWHKSRPADANPVDFR